MDPATSVVMILLWCSPDMLFCRQMPEHHPVAYSTLAVCERALPDRLSRSKATGLVPIGKCQDAGASSNVVSWGISPNGELLTSVAPAANIDPLPTASVPANETHVAANRDSHQDKPQLAETSPDYTTVRVTRGLGSAAETTSYVVKRSN
jgi:hypothetical protein